MWPDVEGADWRSEAWSLGTDGPAEGVEGVAAEEDEGVTAVPGVLAWSPCELVRPSSEDVALRM